MDYTPGSMVNMNRIDYERGNANYASLFTRPMSLGTRAHQVAMYVVYEAPLQMMCESPTIYYREQETVDFITKIPTVWDETHVFGTDQIGRDILSRLIYGARNTMGIALLTTLLSFLIGGALGLIAAIDRGLVDQTLGRAMDILMAIPSLIFALMLLSIFGSTVTSLIIIIAILDSTRVFRLTRSVAVGVVVMDYVEVARLRGEGLGWVMRREILPNVMPPLIAEFGLRFCFVF